MATNLIKPTDRELTEMQKEFEQIAIDFSKEVWESIRPIAIVATVDWLTITAKSSESRMELYKCCKPILDQVRATNGTVKPWKFKNYAGYNAEGFRWGTRPDSDIAMMSASDAQEYWKIFLPYAENVTRIDLAVTVETARPIPQLLDYYYDWEEDTHRRGLSTQRYITCSLLKNNWGGQTLYVGSRSSDQLGRVYDKAAEQKMWEHVGRLWRYEVEYKRERAKAVATRLLEQTFLSKSVDENIRSTVYLWFDGREVPPLFSHTGNELSLEIEGKVTSDEIALKWLSTQVAPTVQRLLKKGKWYDLYDALGYKLDKNQKSV